MHGIRPVAFIIIALVGLMTAYSSVNSNIIKCGLLKNGCALKDIESLLNVATLEDQITTSVYAAAWLEPQFVTDSVIGDTVLNLDGVSREILSNYTRNTITMLKKHAPKYKNVEKAEKFIMGKLKNAER